MQIINEKKVYRDRLKHSKKCFKSNSIAQYSRGDVDKYASTIVRFLLNLSDSISISEKRLKIPSKLNFREGFKDCANILSKLPRCYYGCDGHLILDFTDCREASVSALVVLKTMINELLLFGDKISKVGINKN